MTKSIYDQLNASGTIAKQRVVETFTGDALDTDRWNLDVNDGSGNVVAMTDEVDGGVRITTSGTAFDRVVVGFNNKRQYAHTGAELIGVRKVTSSTGNHVNHIGFVDTLGNGFVSGRHFVSAEFHSGVTNYSLQSGDGSAISRISTTPAVARDTNWHTFKVRTSNPTTGLSIDGALEATKTSNPPATNMQPAFEELANDGVAYQGQVRYVEAYNT